MRQEAQGCRYVIVVPSTRVLYAKHETSEPHQQAAVSVRGVLGLVAVGGWWLGRAWTSASLCRDFDRLSSEPPPLLGITSSEAGGEHR